MGWSAVQRDHEKLLRCRAFLFPATGGDFWVSPLLPRGLAATSVTVLATLPMAAIAGQGSCHAPLRFSSAFLFSHIVALAPVVYFFRCPQVTRKLLPSGPWTDCSQAGCPLGALSPLGSFQSRSECLFSLLAAEALPVLPRLSFLLSLGFVAFPHEEAAQRKCPLATEVLVGLAWLATRSVAGDGQAPCARVEGRGGNSQRTGFDGDIRPQSFDDSGEKWPGSLFSSFSSHDQEHGVGSQPPEFKSWLFPFLAV